MIKMSIAATIMLTEIMILAFNCFNLLFNLQKAMSQFIKEIEVSEKKHQNITLFITKLNVKSTKFQLYRFRKVSTSKFFSI